MKINVDYFAIAAALVFLGLYLLVFLSNPIAFGDEGSYASIGRWIAENQYLPKYVPYEQTNIYNLVYTRLPLFPLVEVVPYILLGEIGIKLINPLITILASLLLYVFLRNRVGKIAGLVAEIALLSTPAVVTYGVLVYTDVLLALMFMCCIYFSYEAVRRNRLKYALAAGIFSGMTIMTKTTGIFLVGGIFLYLLLTEFRNKKILSIIFVVSAITFAPYLIKNIITYGGPCYLSMPEPLASFWNAPGCSVEPSIISQTENNFAGRTVETGTEASIKKIGLIGFSGFGFGLALPILAIFGLGLALSDRKKENMLFLFLSVVMVLMMGANTTTRAEDVGRYVVPAVVGIAGLAGIFASGSYEFLKEQHKYIAVALIVVFITSIFFYGYDKINTMNSVKKFAPQFFEGCDWIKKNTDKDAILLSLHTHPTVYNCERNAIWEIPDKRDILLTNADIASEHLKAHGINYVYVQLFSVSQQPLEQEYPASFVVSLENSTKFQRIYDNTQKYGNAGVAVYKVV